VLIVSIWEIKKLHASVTCVVFSTQLAPQVKRNLCQIETALLQRLSHACRLAPPRLRLECWLNEILLFCFFFLSLRAVFPVSLQRSSYPTLARSSGDKRQKGIYYNGKRNEKKNGSLAVNKFVVYKPPL